ncbi:MAG TPA: FkbM family methyltransferase [Candidatus Acidoferrales bacterium]|nr:FkbM family methyltransferase [Candidatus Acidoferrales bacterium]
MRMLRRLVPRNGCVLDLGANIGVYTNFLSRVVGEYGWVCAFEPVEQNYEILRISVRRLENVRAFHAAIGEASGRQEIAIPTGLVGYYQAHLGAAKMRERKEVVNVLALDDVVLPRVDFIKCDVEGSELAVLKGAKRLIEVHRPGWYMEVSKPTSAEVFGVMKDWGYAAFVHEDDRLVAAPAYRDGEYSNYFFLRGDPLAGEYKH